MVQLETNSYKQLFSNVSNGDEKSFEKLYYLYFPRLYAFALKILNNEDLSKDVVQEVFIRFWEKSAFFVNKNPEAFLFRMVKNACINNIRHQKIVEQRNIEVKNQYQGEELYAIDMMSDEPYALIEKELREEINEVFYSLPEKCRLVFKMSRIDGLKNQEIASLLKVSIKTVEKHITKALKIYKKNFPYYLLLFFVL